MDFSKKNILVITDGSEGMISQVIGLAQEFNNNINSVKTKLLFPWSFAQPGFLPIYSWIFINKLDFAFKPDIVISCGRRSVYLSIFLKRKYKNLINIHIQNPKINFKNFNYIVAPSHDSIKGKNVINSVGALHKFNNQTLKNIENENFELPKNNLISVMVGGNNNHFKFGLNEINDLSNRIKEIKKKYQKYKFLILTSRRTSAEMTKTIYDNLKDTAIIWQNNKKNPYTFALKYSDFFIVSSDSTSMISECAVTGKPIFVFHLPNKRRSKRIDKFHNQFSKLNITRKLEFSSDLLSWSYDSLNESKRIASIVKERIIKDIK